MKMKFKKILNLVILLFLLLFVCTNSVGIQAYGNSDDSSTTTDMELCGFTIPEGYKSAYNYGVRISTFERNFEGDKHTTMLYECVVIKKTDYTGYVYMYKIVTSPYQGRKFGFLGIGSYGENYYNYLVQTNVDFPFDYKPYLPTNFNECKILSYGPMNEPNKKADTISVGLDSNGLSCGVSSSIDHSELNIVSNTRSADLKYSTLYTIDDDSKSNYASKEAAFSGAIALKKKGFVYIHPVHKIQYKIINQGITYFRSTKGLVSFDYTYTF